MARSATSVTSIKQFFTHSLSPEQLSKMAQGVSVKALEEQVAKQIPGFKLPPSFYQQMFTQLLELLDIQIPTQLGKAWSKYQELRKYRDLEAYPAEKQFFVPVAEHTFHDTYEPSLEPTINEIPLGKVTFNIKFELTIKGMMLKIQGGKILEIGIGSCSGKGSIACANVTLMEQETKAVSLPGSMDLGEGMLIFDPSRDLSPTQTPPQTR